MTRGTNEHSHPRSQTRNFKREALIFGFAGMMFALVAVMSFPAADTWYLILGTCIIALGAVMFVAKAIIALRTDDQPSTSK